MTRADKAEIDRRITLYTQNDVSKCAAKRRREGLRETLALVPPLVMYADRVAGHDRAEARKKTHELYKKIHQASRGVVTRDPAVVAARKAYDEARRGHH